MGMRATIGYVKDSGETAVTSVQWSTMLDRTLGIFLGEVEKAGADPKTEVKRIFETVTNYDHASAVDVDDHNQPNFGTNVDLGFGIVAERVQERYDSDVHFYKSETDVPSGSIQGYHLDGGSIGAIYREGSDEIELFWLDSDCETIITDALSMTDLKSHYEQTPDELIDFSFRTDVE